MNHMGKRDMANRSVISVHTKPETSKRLEELATLTRRSKSFLANEAIERYLSEEAVSYTHLTLPTSCVQCRCRWWGGG